MPVNVSVAGKGQGMDGDILIVAVGLELIVYVFVAVRGHEPTMVFIVMVNVPEGGKVCCTEGPEAVSPSPKSQDVPLLPKVVFVRLTTSPGHM